MAKQFGTPIQFNTDAGFTAEQLDFEFGAWQVSQSVIDEARRRDEQNAVNKAACTLLMD